MSDEREQGDDITRFIGGNDETRFTGVGAPPAVAVVPPESTIAPGSLLGHTYRIEVMLARGGMGEVYRARHGELNTEHALKIILPELASNTRIVDLFRREASMLRTVRHDAVVAYDGIFRDENGRLYLVMEFVDGPSLSKLMRERTLGADEIRQLRDRLADGLAVAHDKGVIHRDISPDNVILPGGDLGQAKIIDFGIAKAADPEVKTIIGDDFAGKYAYVSPEQLGMFGGKIDGRSDIYSLGLVLVAAALGEPLDMGQSPIAVIEARRTVPDLSRVPEGVRADLAAMLEPDPANRPQTMRELVRPSERHQERRSVLSEAAREPAPAARSTRSLQIAGALAVVVLLAGGVGYWFISRGGGDDKTETAQGTETATQPVVATTASDGGAAAIEGAGQSEGSTAASGSNAGASETTATQQETTTADTTTSSSVASNETVTPTADSAATAAGGAPSESSAASDTATSTQQNTAATDATTSATDATTSATDATTSATDATTSTTVASNDTATVAGDSEAQSGADSAAPTVTFVDPTAGAAAIGTSAQQTVSSASESSETGASAGQTSADGATEVDAGAADQAPTTTAATEQSTATGGALDAASSAATSTTDNGAVAVATDAAATAGGGIDVGDTQVALGPNLGKLREDARRAVESLSCAGVRADVTDAGEILASGYVASEADRNKALARLAIVPNAGRVDNGIAIMAPPLCDVLDVLRAHTAFDQGAPALDPGGAAGVYREGDHIKVAVTPPAGFEGYLYVDYFDAKERYVIHLVPNSNFRSENRVRAGEPMVIGTLPKEYDTYQIQPPFGDNLIVAVVSRQPLFDGMRPIQESIDAYLPALRSSLKQAAGADVASAYAGVELKPR